VFLVVLSSVIGLTVMLWGPNNSQTGQMLARHLSGARPARVCQTGLDAGQPWLELARAGPDPPVALVKISSPALVPWAVGLGPS
jgi:hypothetical protein